MTRKSIFTLSFITNTEIPCKILVWEKINNNNKNIRKFLQGYIEYDVNFLLENWITNNGPTKDDKNAEVTLWCTINIKRKSQFHKLMFDWRSEWVRAGSSSFPWIPGRKFQNQLSALFSCSPSQWVTDYWCTTTGKILLPPHSASCAICTSKRKIPKSAILLRIFWHILLILFFICGFWTSHKT